MNFDLTTDQKALVDSVRSYVQKELPASRLRALRDEPVGWSPAVWRQMGELGWLALPFPEDVGGLGQTFIDVALVVEQLGSTLVPEPYVPSIVLAGMLLDQAGDAEQRMAWLPRLTTGEIVLSLAYAERRSRFDAGRIETKAARDGDGYVLSGDKEFVLAGAGADAFIVTARTSGGVADHEGISLFIVPKDTAGLTIKPVRTTDGHRAANLSFKGVRVPGTARIGAEGKGWGPLTRALDRAAAASCSEAVGLMDRALRMTVEYLGTREQFGVKIGTFQALQHRAVDMFIETELARSVALLSATHATSEDDNDRARAVSAAKAHVGTSGRTTLASAIQLHGGIGISDEHDIGLYFKRMHVLATLFGDEEFHLERYSKSSSFAAGL